MTVNHWVAGSSPARGAKLIKCGYGVIGNTTAFQAVVTDSNSVARSKLLISEVGEIGNRIALKMRRLKAYGFESHTSHQLPLLQDHRFESCRRDQIRRLIVLLSS